jgi:hypothetical protein
MASARIRPPSGAATGVIIRLPLIGRIEAYCIWVTEDRAWLPVRADHPPRRFHGFIEELQPNPRLRRRG